MKPQCALPLALAAALALACGSGPEEVKSEGKPVIVMPIELRDLEVRIEGTGELLAKHQAQVAAQVAGEITMIRRDEGDAVAEGDVVVEIDPERRQLDLARAKARAEEARAALGEERRSLGRVRKLHKQNVASQAQLDQAETALRTSRSRLHAAEADLGVAERALRDASVTAAFSGLIAKRMVSRGEFVNAGRGLFELVSLDPIEVEFHLPEADASRVRVGMPLEVEVAPYPDEYFEAVITVVSPTIDPRTRTLRVKGLISNEDKRLRPGLFAKVDVGVAQRRDVILVPEEAVLRRAGGAIMFLVHEVDGQQRVERIGVDTGAFRDGLVEIRRGLRPSDVFVSRGHSDLIDGSVITARNPDGTPAHAGPRTAASATDTPQVAAEPPGEVVTQ